ncbi:MAG: hypothetical protein LM591_05315, partial [Candidatus Korarchaeum sp.]|nr:hypothetical protein [Candidatus Korarchaeum sp.]
ITYSALIPSPSSYPLSFIKVASGMMRKVPLSIAVLLISSASLHLLQDVEFREGYGIVHSYRS